MLRQSLPRLTLDVSSTCEVARSLLPVMLWVVSAINQVRASISALNPDTSIRSPQGERVIHLGRAALHALPFGVDMLPRGLFAGRILDPFTGSGTTAGSRPDGRVRLDRLRGHGEPPQVARERIAALQIERKKGPRALFF